MATYTREKLSGSTNGRPIAVAATSTPGTTIHTAVAGASAWDEIYMWFTNIDSSARTLTIEFGNAGTNADHLVDAISLPANSPPIPLITGHILQNSLAVKAFASVTNIINASGFVARYS